MCHDFTARSEDEIYQLLSKNEHRWNPLLEELFEVCSEWQESRNIQKVELKSYELFMAIAEEFFNNWQRLVGLNSKSFRDALAKLCFAYYDSQKKLDGVITIKGRQFPAIYFLLSDEKAMMDLFCLVLAGPNSKAWSALEGEKKQEGAYTLVVVTALGRYLNRLAEHLQKPA